MKCAYCALHSRAGSTKEAREVYVKRLSEAISAADQQVTFKTVYFGGGTPALCDLQPLFKSLEKRVDSETEWTVELNPLDVTEDLLKQLLDGGVNRISMGMQSLDDGILREMGRGYTFCEAERAFFLIKEYFSNAGIDLIIGYPGEKTALSPKHARLAKWGLVHCSAYSLIVEEKTLLEKKIKNGSVNLPDDDTVMNRLSIIDSFMQELGLKRYEISNWSKPGYECRHNFAVWNGEDYFGLGEGAHGRIGLKRTKNMMSLDTESDELDIEKVDEERDRKERYLFSLRTSNGLQISKIEPSERMRATEIMETSVRNGLAEKDGDTYRLTSRGYEVCDSILEELI
jgi:oxygen-independent coproporphyrinogen-3 oxidase